MILNSLALFLQIVEKGSLTAAGREAGLSSTTVSERLAALEAHFGVVLPNYPHGPLGPVNTNSDGVVEPQKGPIKAHPKGISFGHEE